MLEEAGCYNLDVTITQKVNKYHTLACVTSWGNYSQERYWTQSSFFLYDKMENPSSPTIINFHKLISELLVIIRGSRLFILHKSFQNIRSYIIFTYISLFFHTATDPCSYADLQCSTHRTDCTLDKHSILFSFQKGSSQSNS
jgi:hypothetical protein